MREGGRKGEREGEQWVEKRKKEEEEGSEKGWQRELGTQGVWRTVAAYLSLQAFSGQFNYYHTLLICLHVYPVLVPQGRWTWLNWFSRFVRVL